ncbi:hypothetical protein AVDCRST_MAG94-2825 [uncultured Leptolyngbya sp.]|uniref:Uncharacterized protein n=2 Tax=Cyanophyceae TaxID=3028117 RepID=A0A6J4M6V8_9CYAN|nr:hypothetical protein AVDCRST_MAG94-2825 [uncultured Leptolyngbya sp.]CAA9579884.1 hypothetical protein AVDCRST_MAG81-2727 [uncultured Synechococcales cyanobacterium]
MICAEALRADSDNSFKTWITDLQSSSTIVLQRDHEDCDWLSSAALPQLQALLH